MEFLLATFRKKFLQKTFVSFSGLPESTSVCNVRKRFLPLKTSRNMNLKSSRQQNPFAFRKLEHRSFFPISYLDKNLSTRELNCFSIIYWFGKIDFIKTSFRLVEMVVGNSILPRRGCLLLFSAK